MFDDSFVVILAFIFVYCSSTKYQWSVMGSGEDGEMPPMRRVARRTARRTASRQSAAAPPPQEAPAAPGPASPADPATPAEPAYVAELEQLNQLKEQGILSEEEYSAKKQQILGL
jgi:Short C-terminal domain